jgi:hypothetical protein
MSANFPTVKPVVVPWPCAFADKTVQTVKNTISTRFLFSVISTPSKDSIRRIKHAIRRDKSFVYYRQIREKFNIYFFERKLLNFLARFFAARGKKTGLVRGSTRSVFSGQIVTT